MIFLLFSVKVGSKSKFGEILNNCNARTQLTVVTVPKKERKKKNN